jgi:hypothetical protein
MCYGKRTAWRATDRPAGAAICQEAHTSRLRIFRSAIHRELIESRAGNRVVGVSESAR